MLLHEFFNQFALTAELNYAHQGINNLFFLFGLFFFRGLGTRAERGEMDPLPADTTLEILGGPVCEGDANNILRWYVRVMDGPRAGYEGWAQEGITDERTMAPISQRIQQDAPGE